MVGHGLTPAEAFAAPTGPVDLGDEVWADGKKIGVVTAGHVSTIMDMAGVRMPIESQCLQALVSEPIKPVIDCVVMANTVDWNKGNGYGVKPDFCLYLGGIFVIH